MEPSVPILVICFCCTIHKENDCIAPLIPTLSLKYS